MADLVALQTMLPKIDSPYEQQGAALKIQQMQGAAQDAQYQRQQQAQAQQDDASYRQALQTSGGDSKALLSSLAGAGNYKGHAAAMKADLDQRKGNADIEKDQATTQETKLKALNQAFTLHRDQINHVTDPTTAAQWVASAYQDPVLGPLVSQSGPLEAAVARIPRDPAGFAQWKLQAGTSADEYVKRTTVDANTAANNATSVKTAGISAAASKYSADSNARTAGARLKFDKEQAEGADPGDTTSANMVDLIGTGRMAPPTGYALRNPKILAMMDQVAKKYPDFDATEYAGKTKAMRDFTTGKQGDSIRSFAVAGDHLGQLGKLVDALDNGNIPLVNKYGNMIAQQTGSDAPTNFDAAKGIVAKEVLKSIVAGGGGVEERQELAHLLDNAKTTKQLKGVISTYQHLMAAQHDGLVRQYELSTGRKDAATRFKYDTGDAPAAGGVVDFGSLK